MTINPLIPTQSQTVLPGGDFRAPTGVVEGSTPSVPQPGTRATPRTPSGSGVYGAAGSITPMVQPIRDYVVTLTNPTDNDFRMRYLTVEYRIAAHDSLVVPWEVMCSFMGSPEVMNMGPRRMDRKNVYEKLRVKYGAYYDDDLWEQNKPKLIATRVTGERIITVVDDPEGLTVTPSSTTQQQQLVTEAAMNEMQRQMVAMQAIIAQLSGQAQPGATIQDVPPIAPMPEDAPEQPDWVPGAVNDNQTMAAPTVPAPAPITTPNVTAQPLHPGAVIAPPPPPVANMTPGMPVQPAPVAPLPPQTLADDQVAPDTQPQGATVDSPANAIRIG